MIQSAEKIAYGCLAVAVIWIGVFGAVRAHHVEPINPDEAMYLRQARFISRVARISVGLPVPVLREDMKGIWRYVRKDDWYSKPCWGHSALYALPAIAGAPLRASGMGVNILFGMGSVVLVFLIARQCGGPLAGGVAALLLGFSHYWLLYVRSFMAEVDSTAFALLATWLVIAGSKVEKGWWWRVSLAALASAMAALCHYRVLYMCVLLAVAVFALYRNRRVRAAAIFAVTGVAFVLILDVAMRTATSFLAKGLPFTGLLGAIFERYLPSSAEPSHTAFQPANILAYLRYMLTYQGVGILAMCAVGVVSVVRNRSRDAYIALAVIGGTFLILACQKWIVARAGVLMVPYVCIAAGIGVVHLMKVIKPAGVGYAILLGIAVLAAVENLPANVRLVQNEYGYQRAAEFLVESEAEEVYADSEGLRIIEFFAATLQCRRLRDLSPPIAPDAFAVFDAMHYHAYPRQTERVAAKERAVAVDAECVFRSANMTTTWQDFLRDGTQAHTMSGQKDSILAADEASISSIRVYRHRPVSQ